jgi:RNA polymerase sigma-70 factor (ECF subfamily)
MATGSPALPMQLPGDFLLMLGYDESEHGAPIGSKALTQQQTLDRFLAGVQKRAFRMAQLATRNREDAFDIVQDTMLKLVENYADRPESELAPLFFRILQSRIHDWYRRSSVRNRLRIRLGSDDEDEEDPMQLVADPAGRSAEQLLITEDCIATLNAALLELPLRQQQVFLLRAWEGLDVRQTAAVMQCAEGSVKTHYSRALAALKGKLGEHWQ